MKKVLILLIFSIFLSNCTTDELSNSTTSSSESILPVVVSPLSENNNDSFARPIKVSTEILISNVTRGFSSSIFIKDGKLTKNSSGIVSPTTIQISNAKWEVLKQKFAALNLVRIPSYNAPSCLRCSDMDLGQTLEIKHNGVNYTSKVYDSTNPPAALKDFLFYVNTIN